MNRASMRRALVVALYTAGVACGGGDTTRPVVPPPPPAPSVATTIELSASAATMAVGDSVTLRATVFDQRHAPMPDAPVTFTLSDSSLAVLDSARVLVARYAGFVAVTARSGSSAYALLSIALHGPSVSWAQVAAGADHTCALTTSGVAYCWGGGFQGQLGTTVPKTCASLIPDVRFPCTQSPVRVNTTRTFKAIFAGLFSTCALTESGEAYCWGANRDGDLGVGNLDTIRVPAPVVGGHRFATLALDLSHSCGITTAGATYCWGMALNGQLGIGYNGDVTPRLVPTPVVGSLIFTAISVASGTTCAIATSRQAYCWGNIWDRSLPNGFDTGFGANLPTPVPGGLEYSAIAVGEGTICGLTPPGGVSCWGSNRSGSFGNGSLDGSKIPLASQGTGYSALVRGGFHMCALRGTIPDCWGDNGFAQLGIGETSPDECPMIGATGKNCAQTPQPVLGGQRYVSMAAGNTHTCGITAAGELYCWGNNFIGQLGHTTLPNNMPGRVNTPLN